MQVFISSVYRDSHKPGDEVYLDIRRRLHELDLSEKVKVWTAEHEAPGLEKDDWRTIVDTCIHAVHESDLMVVLLFRRWGTPVAGPDIGLAPASYLEVELFHASLRRMPVLFFQAEDYEPEPELKSLIQLVRRIGPATHWITAPQAALEMHVVEVLRAIDKRGHLPEGMTQFCDALSDEVSFSRVSQEIDSTRLSFTSGFAPAASAEFSLGRADLLLAEARRLSGEGEGTLVDRLSRLWLALRELAKLPVDALDAQLAVRWTELCELWNSSAAWLHLHGPMRLSVLASLHTRTQLKRVGLYQEQMFPFGAFASEAYSIAKASDTPRWQRRRFTAARRLASRQIELESADPSGAYGIRASATMQLAQRGRPWLAAAGIWDYRQMVAVRRRAGASDSEIGEALGELGYAEYMVGRSLPWVRRFALDRLREGVELLDQDHPERRPGFVVRAKKKLAEALEHSGFMDEAKSQRDDIRQLQQRHGLPPD